MCRDVGADRCAAPSFPVGVALRGGARDQDDGQGDDTTAPPRRPPRTRRRRALADCPSGHGSNLSAADFRIGNRGPAIVSVVTLFAGCSGRWSSQGCLRCRRPRPPNSLRMVVFVAIHGQGTVTSMPRGIHCPGVCRGDLPEHAHVELHHRRRGGSSGTSKGRAPAGPARAGSCSSERTTASAAPARSAPSECGRTSCAANRRVERRPASAPQPCELVRLRPRPRRPCVGGVEARGAPLARRSGGAFR